MRGAAAAFAAQLAQARLFSYRATQVLSTAEQRALAEGVQRGELPGWMNGVVAPNRLSHLLIVTRTRGEAAFVLPDGGPAGRAEVEGVGMHLDPRGDPVGAGGRPVPGGFLGPHALVRLQLVDAASGSIVVQQDLHEARAIAGRGDDEPGQPWNALAPDEKVTVLRDLLQQGVQRVLTRMLEDAGRS